MNAPESYHEELLSLIMTGAISSKRELHRAKLDLCGKYGLVDVPSDSEVLSHATPGMRGSINSLLRVKPTRSASGVAVVSVMTAPHPCPHGRCVYCPGGPSIGTPQSYTGREPAAMRAAQHEYDPFSQTLARLEQLQAIGHPTDKIELIILGGTFTNLDFGYRERFVKRCLDAMNRCDSRDITEAQSLNETATSRCVGLTMETRPDCFDERTIDHSMAFGVTRVEFGVQSTDDGILKRVQRGHTVQQTREATMAAKNAGLKVCYHMMPGLPGSTPATDLESFKRIFEEEPFKPDMLKIYPTVVLKGTGLYDMWKRGEYAPLSTEEAVELIVKVKRMVPPWVRIQRIQREIEVDAVQAGLDKGHLRNLARRAMASRGERCWCIRCREVGLTGHALARNDVILRRIDYQASGGKETFLSLENNAGDAIVGYLRMRHCGRGTFLRELKVFGEVVPFGDDPEDRWQHQGYGHKLVSECERIAADELGASEVRVTSGVGARGYYRRLGYELREPYMVKAF